MSRRTRAVREASSRMLVEMRSVLRDPVLFVWALYLLLTPLYVFPSGLPQPSDFLVFLMVPMVLRKWNGRLPSHHRRVVLALFAFLAYVVASTVIWSVVVGTVSINLKVGFLLSPLFWIFNTALFLLALVSYQHYGDRFIRLIVWMTLIAGIIQVPFTLLIHGGGLRSAGMFNNPNQLGYYAALTAAVILIGQKRVKLSTAWVTAGLVAASYLAIVSASKAGLVSIALIIAIAMLNRLRTIIVFGLVATTLVLFIDPVTDIVAHSAKRIMMSESKSFVEDRGYDRILNHPEYWLVGSGEGAYERFADTTAIGAHELHSSAGTLFFCYGVAGTLLFLWFVVRVLALADVRQVLMAVAVAAYGLSHHGLRVTHLWLFFALMALLGARAQARPRAPPMPVRAKLEPVPKGAVT